MHYSLACHNTASVTMAGPATMTQRRNVDQHCMKCFSVLCVRRSCRLSIIDTSTAAVSPVLWRAAIAIAARRTYATVDATEANLNNNNRALTPRARSAQVSCLTCA
jgi:hypothetical protein